jgi:hypothetical protein
VTLRRCPVNELLLQEVRFTNCQTYCAGFNTVQQLIHTFSTHNLKLEASRNIHAVTWYGSELLQSVKHASLVEITMQRP